MWLAYNPLLDNGYVFYVSASRLYKWYGTESREKEKEKENENGASPRQSGKKGSAED
jgi:hypothetical protein